MMASKKTDLQDWFDRVERLRYSPDWGAGQQIPVPVTQTHISMILLGAERVLKLKKPVDFGFLDYTTLEKRQAACDAEVRLNRRLCSDTYLGVVPITEDNGIVRFGTSGTALDYAVLMARLHEDRMLDVMVRRGHVTEATIRRVADRLWEFHKAARRDPEVEAWGRLDQIRRNWDENFEQTRPYIDRTISKAGFQRISEWVSRCLDQDAALFERRVSEARIVDGHGDLRCESINMTANGICFFDCIEFNDRFRCCDVASELAFLAMDLDSLGRPDLGYYLAERYQEASGDPDLFRLLPFYRCYRAYVRGKVLSFRLDEAEFAEVHKRRASDRAARYFELARRYADPLRKKQVIVVRGLSGTGKTSIARAIAGELGLRVVSTDAVRAELFQANKAPAVFGEGAYTPDATALTYRTVLDHGATILSEDGGVILDGTFLDPKLRNEVLQWAQQAGAVLSWIRCDLPPEEVRDRLARRHSAGDTLSDADWDIYLRQRSLQQEEAEVPNSLLLETSADLAAVARSAADWLRRPL